MSREDSIFKDLNIRDPEQAFDNAIKQGMQDPEDWMYMYSNDHRDYFKHCVTRQYMAVAYRQLQRPGPLVSAWYRVLRYILKPPSSV